MTRRLIEEWLPIAELGIESLRERTPMTPFPAPNRLHVWWARRPLVASRAAILASLLPADADRKKFMHVLGIHGDPVASRRKIDAAKQTGERFEGEAYSYPRAFSYSPTAKDLDWFAYEARRLGLDRPSVLDPTAGGGSVPFESVRLGLTTYANDLNPVAVLIERATIEFPLNLGLDVLREFRRLADKFVAERESRLKPFFPPEPDPDCVATNFLWARTITCPYCDGLVPLSPNWRLNSEGMGIRLHPQTAGPRICTFEVVASAKSQSLGTVDDGTATCPFPECGRVVNGDVIKEQAKAGRMGEQLFCVVFKKQVEEKTAGGRRRTKWVRGFRAPSDSDDNTAALRAMVEERLPDWFDAGFVPSEAIGEVSNYDRGHKLYGMRHWRDLFSPRQLLGHATACEVFAELLARETKDRRLPEETRAAFAYLALCLDKMRDYNSRMTRWHVPREVVVNTFDGHKFSFKWSYVEMAPLVEGLGFDWAVDQTAKCIEELVELARPDIDVRAARRNGEQAELPVRSKAASAPVTITCKSGDSLDHVAGATIEAVVMDPPYYDNVMYAELSDFFYVWLKRTAGLVFPELFRLQLTDKDNEAVANAARFRDQEGPAERASRDYQEKMAGIFAECRRVLRPDGILTLMFTHKATGAWDALTKGLMTAGFVITASWPVNTEAEGSNHIKDKSAANSTIFLVCRPRAELVPDAETVFWEDVEPKVRAAVRKRIADFEKAGIRRVDLYLSSFGPALEEFSRHWPLKRGTPRAVPEERRRRRQRELFPEEWDPYAATPEDALDAARHEVKAWRLEKLTRTQRQAELDKLTEWFVLAWDAFGAPAFPYDEALRLARVVGLDLDRDIVGTLAEKKQSDLLLWDSAKRAARGSIGPPDGSKAMIDALHHAAHQARTRTVGLARELVEKVGVDKEPAFLRALEAVLEVLPPSRQFTGIDLPDAAADAGSDFEALENLRRLAFAEQIDRPQQLPLPISEEPSP